MPANYEFSDLQSLLSFSPTNGSSPFLWQADPLDGAVIYLADEQGLWMSVPDESDPDMDFKALTGFQLNEVERKKRGDFFIYTLKNGEALLPFPFTAAQLLKLDRRTSGIFSEGINCGDETDELIAEIAQRDPRAAELARAVVYGDIPPEPDARYSEIDSLFQAIEKNDANIKYWCGRTDVTASDAAIRQAKLEPLEAERTKLELRKRQLRGDDLTSPAQVDEIPITALHSERLAGRGVTEQVAERRLSRLRALGGECKYANGSWKFTGITKLVKDEKANGRGRNDEKTIRADLKAAAQAERDARSAGAFTGLGQR